MANLRELAESMGTATGWSPEDISSRARRLRETGLIAGSRQGRGATPYTAHDAAMVLIAMLATSNPSRTVPATRECWEMKQALVRNCFGTYITDCQHLLPEGFRGAKFGDVLTYLLEVCGSPDGRADVRRAVFAIEVRRTSSLIATAGIDLLSGSPARAWSLVFVPHEATKAEIAKVHGMTRIRVQRDPLIAEASITGEVQGDILPIIGELLVTDRTKHAPRQAIKWPDFQRAA